MLVRVNGFLGPSTFSLAFITNYSVLTCTSFAFNFRQSRRGAAIFGAILYLVREAPLAAASYL